MKRRQLEILVAAAGLVAAWLGFSFVELVEVLRAGSVGPFDPEFQGQAVFWYEFRSGLRSALSPGGVWREASVWYWLALLLVTVGTIAWWERVAKRQEPDAGGVWGRFAWLLPLPVLLGLAWFPVSVYNQWSLLNSYGLLHDELLAQALGEGLAAPWAGLLTAIGLGLCSIPYGRSTPSQARVWQLVGFGALLALIIVACGLQAG